MESVTLNSVPTTAILRLSKYCRKIISWWTLKVHIQEIGRGREATDLPHWNVITWPCKILLCLSYTRNKHLDLTHGGRLWVCLTFKRSKGTWNVYQIKRKVPSLLGCEAWGPVCWVYRTKNHGHWSWKSGSKVSLVPVILNRGDPPGNKWRTDKRTITQTK